MVGIVRHLVKLRLGVVPTPVLTRGEKRYTFYFSKFQSPCHLLQPIFCPSKPLFYIPRLFCLQEYSYVRELPFSAIEGGKLLSKLLLGKLLSVANKVWVEPPASGIIRHSLCANWTWVYQFIGYHVHFKVQEWGD